MSVSVHYKATLSFHCIRYDETTKTIDQGDIELWENSAELLSHREYRHKDRKISISAQWGNLAKALKKRQQKLERMHTEKVKALDIFRPIAVTINMVVSEEAEEQSFSHFYPYMFLEHYMHEVFILTNLSRPGVCDFYGAKLSITPTDKLFRPRDPLKISAYSLECAWEDSLENEFPKLHSIPISETVAWYSKINIGMRQRAKTPIEKALFSFQHLCITGEDISSAVWIFHALEALFSTKVGEGFSNLINRISLVLELTPKQESIVKKKLRKLYDMRGSLIHGGFEIYHPMRNEVLDYEIDSQFMEIYENLQFGASVIICCLQRMIINKSYGIKIQESLSFIK